MTTTTGYVIADNEGLIYGYGPTVDAAWADTERTMAQAAIALLDDDDDSTEQHGSWTRRSGLTAHPATPALLADVEARGGAIAWRSVGGVACTRDEADDAA